MRNMRLNFPMARKRNGKRRAARPGTNHRVTHAKTKTFLNGQHGPSKIDVRRVMHLQSRKIAGRFGHSHNALRGQTFKGKQFVNCFAPLIRGNGAFNNARAGIRLERGSINARRTNGDGNFRLVTRNNSHWS